jgi:hypothetical protein
MGVELAPVKAILDQSHPSLPSQRDQNGYTLGEMGGHNIVIAVLPEIGDSGDPALERLAMQKEEEALIEQEILPSSYRSRQIIIVTAPKPGIAEGMNERRLHHIPLCPDCKFARSWNSFAFEGA